MQTMNSLAQLTIDAHGGSERWRRFEHVSAQLRTDGVLWTLKHQQGVLNDVNVRVALHREWASHAPFGEPNVRTSFEPHRVAIETTDGRVIEERLRPRDSFAAHGIDTPWDRLQLAYFAGYAMWTYLTTPFLVAMDGVSSEELSPWHEHGETWRRLRVTFPPGIATHSTVQTFYIGADGLLTRHDYNVEASGDSPAAHYVHDYQQASGILVPTKRRVLRRRPDGTPAPEPFLVTIDLSAVEFT
jgi:hypothetical protein